MVTISVDALGNAALPRLADLPFHERRYISVVADAEFDRRPPPAVDGAQADTPQDTSSIIPALSLLAPALVPGGILVRGVILIGGIAYTAYAARSDPSSKSDTKHFSRDLIIEVPVRETHSLLFPGRYAEVGRVYGLDPINTKRYHDIRSYNDDLMMSKLSELELILCSLGAKRFDIKYAESELDKAGVKVSADKAPVSLDASAMASSKKRFERSGTSDGREPSLPENLLWYHHETDWQTLANSRLLFGRKEFAFSLELERSLQLTAKAVIAFQALGVDFGANYDRNRNITLTVSGTF